MQQNEYYINMELHSQKMQQLRNLRFSSMDLNTFEGILMQNGRITPKILVACGLRPYEANRIRYMYSIYCERTVIDTDEALIRHLRRIYLGKRRISINDITSNNLGKIPRRAVVSNIPSGKFAVYNSKNYKGGEIFYKVTDVTTTNIVVKTKIKPVFKYKESKALEGVLEVRDVDSEGQVEVAFNKNYCKLCNRFIIAASLRRPSNHHGMYEIICLDGTRLYVFASTLKGNRDMPNLNNGTQRIFCFGQLSKQISIMLHEEARKQYVRFRGVKCNQHPADSQFMLISPEIEEEKDTIGIE